MEYLRLSVTDKCNYRCFYCLPKGSHDFEPPANWLRFDEIERVVGAFAGLGVGRFRLTGGEPLVRKGIIDLAGRLSRLPDMHDLSLSTNASLLVKYAEPLRRAGIGRINVSLDTLKPDRFHDVTGRHLEDVLAGLAAARAAGFSPIKINMVALKGYNDDEVEDMVAFCLANDFTLRFIEAMPMGNPGCGIRGHYLNLQELKAQLADKFPLIPDEVPGGGPARYFRIDGTALRLGFITPISQHFCQDCNRVRLSVSGMLYLCLGKNHRYDLQPLLRAGADDDALRSAILDALALKPERHEFREKPGEVARPMSMTGG